MNNLVIVESPAKSKTIGSYLGPNFTVTSSKGHIRDLTTSGYGGFGVDIENNFAPMYKELSDKKDTIKELKKLVKQADKVYLATDPDREGEAISWHLKEVLNLGEKPYERIVFNEITEKAIKDSLNHGRDIDMNLVHSQESRRILDRIIGFSLSKLLQRKIGSKSGGRVQSVALKLVCDQEKEINAFQKEEYWEITLEFIKDGLEQIAHLMNTKIANEQEAKDIITACGNVFTVKSITKKKRMRAPKPPFITSTLQQDASTKLNFNSKKTMQIAQKLYEGVDINGKPQGLITYMRTDSTRLSDEFVLGAKNVIDNLYGVGYYVGYKNNQKKSVNVQDAHEAIRPSHLDLTPDKVKQYLSNDEYKLYTLIWSQALGALMRSAEYEDSTVSIDANGYTFNLNGSHLVDPGFLKAYVIKEKDDTALAQYYEGETIHDSLLVPHQKFTQAPPRFTEARLIKKMEELGIGRPSTYAQTMETLKTRFYVKVAQKAFIPTNQGMRTSDALAEYFPSIINVTYTAEMEKELDRIAEGQDVWYEDLKAFTDTYLPIVRYAEEHMPKTYPILLEEKCPLCGKPLVERYGRFGSFVACSGYPTCKYIPKKEPAPVIDTNIVCPLCHSGHLVQRTVKRGRTAGQLFYGCSNFPTCRCTFSQLPKEEDLAKIKEIGYDAFMGKSTTPKKRGRPKKTQ